MLEANSRLFMRSVFVGTTTFLLATAAASGCGGPPLGLINTVPDTEANIRGTITKVQKFAAPSNNRSSALPKPISPNQSVSSDNPQVGIGVPQDSIGSILIEEKPEERWGSDKVNVTIKHSTKIFSQHGQSLSPVAFGALSTGQDVKAWFNGPVAESYPAQATASVIIINAGDGSK